MNLKTVYHHMTPMVPDLDTELEDLIVSLIERIALLRGGIHPITCDTMAALVEKMNSYYSNLIEGHYTTPADIERALLGDFSVDPAKRELQVESVAHIEVHRLLVKHFKQSGVPESPCSRELIRWLHKEFYVRMPEEFKVVRSLSGARELNVEPGELRKDDVTVGKYVPPEPEAIADLLRFFAEQYDPSRYDRVHQVLAMASMHHRFLWIHPFVDGNGRIARLLIDAYLLRCGLDAGGLWSPVRGLSRSHDDYKRLLSLADMPRQGGLDGRGNLSARALRDFCRFFISVCIDQVDFMQGLLAPESLKERVEGYVQRRAFEKSLRPEARHILTELIYRGEITRGDAVRVSGLKERTARDMIGRMFAEGLIASDSPKGKLRIAFPDAVREFYFPRLFLPRE
jgi:Fic family protein